MANTKKPNITAWPTEETWAVIKDKIGGVKEIAAFTNRKENMVRYWLSQSYQIPDFIAKDLAQHCELDFFDIRPDLKP